MAIFACGAAMAHYTSHTLTPLTLSATEYLFKGMSVVGETFLFVYLGITAIVSFRSEFEVGSASVYVTPFRGARYKARTQLSRSSCICKLYSWSGHRF
jgi:hypothetical protein